MNHKEFWEAKPYPHLIIDNFIEKNNYNILTKADRLDKDTYVTQHNRSEIEKNKYTLNDSDDPLECHVYDRLNSPEFRAELRELLNVTHLMSLAELSHTFSYYHRSYAGAYLGSHVDHSGIKDKVHVLNAIYYSHPEWEPAWGGYTMVGNIKIAPKPNRLLLFLHTSDSFHGCDTVTCPPTVRRKTIYLDYYVSIAQLANIQQQTPTPLRWWEHGTTFVPGGMKYWKGWIHYKLNQYTKRLM